MAEAGLSPTSTTASRGRNGSAATRAATCARSAAATALPSMTRAAMPAQPSEQQRAGVAEDDRRLDPHDQRDQHELNQQADDPGAEVDPAEVGQDAPDRPQHRLGGAIEEVADRPDDAVARVQHAERGQGLEDRGEDHDPEIDLEHFEDDVEDDRDHGGLRQRRRNLERFPAGRKQGSKRDSNAPKGPMTWPKTWSPLTCLGRLRI